MDVNVVVKLTIKGKEIELTTGELRELKNQLGTILGEDNTTYIPYNPNPYPVYPWSNPPITTWRYYTTDDSGVKSVL